jgi:NADH-quinone oxidoreductase subunit C
MVPEEIIGLVRQRWGDCVLAAAVEGSHPHVTVKAEKWPEIAGYLRDDPRIRLNFLRCISSIDLLADDKLACVYDLCHVPTDSPAQLQTRTHLFAVRIEVERGGAVIPSVADVWPAAEWHEREAFDLMGVTFSGHPDLRRILCADDWVGYPLRKDYEFPLEYHGIPATTEFELTNPRH